MLTPAIPDKRIDFRLGGRLIVPNELLAGLIFGAAAKGLDVMRSGNIKTAGINKAIFRNSGPVRTLSV